MPESVDAVIIGAGPNGLVAANLLADQGWEVLVLEAEDEPGGAVRSTTAIEPGFVVDLFSAFYPLGVASPVITELVLERHGLRWTHAPAVLAHPTPDGPSAVLSRDLGATATSLDRFAAGDGAAWAELMARWAQVEEPLLAAALRPMPPLRPAASLVRRLGARGTADLARLALLPVRRLAEEHFGGEGAALLLAGNALHTDLGPESTASGIFGLLLAGIGQRHGWPVPVGGAGRLTDALVARLVAGGGSVRCGARVDAVEVRAGRATGVRVVDGSAVTARRAVIADVVAPQLYGWLLRGVPMPGRVAADLARYQPGAATFKVNWALDRPVPWADPEVGSAGTVHLADSVDELSRTTVEIATGALPSRPFLLIGQMTTADATRSPAGTESLWAYTHVPQQVRGDAGGDGLTGRWDAAESERFADRVQARIEQYAPGFGACVRSRHLQSPTDLQHADANLIGGDTNLGTAQLHQQAIFRPTTGWARPETFVDRLYLGSASAHPGGGVHGACGANAARAALWAHRRGRWRGER
ncbi:MAG TPA: NAD(P)/FAD-dependent oxidoreductase [Acidimicrobiales bacterium]|nr:NAD(P)/FAD-dependent oxidoreductase [Acidimicrobiales bacterium]